MKKADKLRAQLAATETPDSTEKAPVATAPPPPEPALDARLIPIGKIQRSPKNPRTIFNSEKQQELMDLMRAHGFTSTLLARPCPDTFRLDEGNAEAQSDGQFFVMRLTPAGVESAVEMCATREKAEALLATLQDQVELVDGHRRLLAAKGVGFEKLPCVVRTMSDAEVLAIQLSENGEKLTAMEEAHGLRAALALRDAQGGAVYSRETLAAAIGKTPEHIRRRVGLCALADDPALGRFLKAFTAGIVGNRHAQLVMSIPDDKLRAKFAKQILEPQYEEAPLSERKAEAIKRRDYMIELRGAPFELTDATLVPEVIEDGERVRGGACVGCPFMEELTEKSNVRMCMNPGCFELKKTAAWDAWMTEETSLDKKRRALTEDECHKLYNYGDQLNWNCGLVDLGERPDSSELKPGTANSLTWKKLTADSEIEVQVVRDRNGKRHELVERKLAIQAAETAGHKIFKERKAAAAGAGSSGGGSYKTETPEDRAKREQKEHDAEEIEEAAERAVAAAVAEKAANGKAMPDGFWPEVMQQIFEEYYGEAPERLEARRGWKKGTAVSEMKKLQPHHQLAVIAEFLYLSGGDTNGTNIAKLFKVDRKPLEKAAVEKVKEGQKKRVALRVRITELAGQMNLSAKNLDAMAMNTAAKEKFAELKHAGALEELKAALEKLVGKDEKKAKLEDRPKAGLTPEARVKLAVAMKERWAKRAKPKAVKK